MKYWTEMNADEKVEALRDRIEFLESFIQKLTGCWPDVGDIMSDTYREICGYVDG